MKPGPATSPGARRNRARLLASPDLLAALPELRGKVLACWCKDQGHEVPCRGDVLAELDDGGVQDDGEREER